MRKCIDDDAKIAIVSQAGSSLSAVAVAAALTKRDANAKILLRTRRDAHTCVPHTRCHRSLRRSRCCPAAAATCDDARFCRRCREHVETRANMRIKTTAADEVFLSRAKMACLSSSSQQRTNKINVMLYKHSRLTRACEQQNKHFRKEFFNCQPTLFIKVTILLAHHEYILYVSYDNLQQLLFFLLFLSS